MLSLWEFATALTADLRDTGITHNVLLPSGATVTGMLSPDAGLADQRFLDPAVMGTRPVAAEARVG